MANIPIWPGSSSFTDTSNPTPFAFYDQDADFIIEDNIIETLDNNGTEYDNPDYLLTKDTKGVVKTSKITGKKDAMYISVIQQLISKVETLEAKVATLESK